MFFKSAFYATILIAVFYSGCSAKRETVVENNTSKLPVIVPVDVNYSKFHTLISALKIHCHVQVSPQTIDHNNSILVIDYGNYLKIDLKTKRDFKSHSYKLTKDAKEKLKCMAPHILENEDTIVQIIGHANDSMSMYHNQYLSNNRAIRAAELFYTEGIGNEILAKGCPEKKVILDEVGIDDSLIDRSIIIYIYKDKPDVKDPCHIQ